MPAAILPKAWFSSTQPGDQQALDPLRKLDSLTRKANELARSETPKGMREAITVNAELGQLLKTLGDAAGPCFHEQMARRLGIALSRALRLREDAPARARELLDALDPAQKLIELDGVSVLRSEIEDIAGGRLPMTEAEVDAGRERHEALREVEQQIRQGWALNVHIGGVLSSGAWALRELRMRNHGHIPDLASTKTSILKVMAARNEPLASRGLDFALRQNQPVKEGGLDTNIEDVVREVWTYCSRHGEESLRQNLIDAFVTRLRDIGSEQPCNTGCVQRLLQTMEGVDPDFEHAVPDKRALQDEIAGMVAVLDQSLDDQIEIDRQAQNAPSAVEAVIPFKQERMKASIEKSLIERRGLPSELVGQAMRQPLDDVESNELMMADKGYADLDTGYRNYRGETALLRALKRGDHDAVRAQLESARGGDINQADNYGVTALHLAAHDGHADVVEKLLEVQGIEVNKPRDDGVTALHLAAYDGHADVAGKLLEVQGIEVNKPGNDGVTALMLAAQYGHAAVVGRLLEAREIDVNMKGAFGRTAMTYARKNKHADIVEILHQHGARRGFTDFVGGLWSRIRKR